MFYRAQKRTNYWSKIRKKAPKVPDITCPAIDDVINQLEKIIGKELKHGKYRALERKLEKLRKENEKSFSIPWFLILFFIFCILNNLFSIPD